MDAPGTRAAAEDTGQGRTTFGSALTPVKERTVTPWVVAGAAVLMLLFVLAVSGRRHAAAKPNQVLPLDAYAANLVFSDLALSESTSLSGGKSTFLDGKLRNSGAKVVSGVTVQALFANDEGMPSRVETEPLMLIRTREPYVDTQPVSATPLKPGDEREFRLIFESLPQNWNTQMPELHATAVTTK